MLPVARLSIDRRGIRMNLAENLARDFPQVVAENFTNEAKERWATDFKITLQRREVVLPRALRPHAPGTRLCRAVEQEEPCRAVLKAMVVGIGIPDQASRPGGEADTAFASAPSGSSTPLAAHPTSDRTLTNTTGGRRGGSNMEGSA